jgi:hypothetical protein
MMPPRSVEACAFQAVTEKLSQNEQLCRPAALGGTLLRPQSRQ